MSLGISNPGRGKSPQPAKNAPLLPPRYLPPPPCSKMFTGKNTQNMNTEVGLKGRELKGTNKPKFCAEARRRPHIGLGHPSRAVGKWAALLGFLMCNRWG